MRIILSTAQAVTLAKAIKPAIGTDPVRVHLTTVRISATEDMATFTATDGYRMHQVIVNPGADHVTGDEINVSGVELVSSLLSFAKIIGKGEGSITLTDDTTTGEPMCAIKIKATTGDVVFVDIINRDFPSCSPILGATPATSELVCQFESEYLADIVTAAGVVAKTKKRKGVESMSPVKILNINPSKPCHVTATNNDLGMEFHGVIMPQRP